MEEVVSRKTTLTTVRGKENNSNVINYVIYYIFGIIEVLILFRLVFKLTGANPASGFVNFIYSLTQIFTSPFSGIFYGATTEGNVVTAVLEPSTLVAIVVYALLAWGITHLIEIITNK